jgi:undecaprenyl-diphosphatase
MNEVLRAILLGVVQGLTEFLPVSSSGHLELAKYLSDDPSKGEASLLMTVVLHFATALSTVVVFRKDIAQIFKGLLKFEKNESTEFSLKIVLSMLPATFVGLMWEDAIEGLFSKQILLVGVALLVSGGLLYWANSVRKTDKPLGYLEALIIGVAQAIAITPGISRSGATISSSLLLGVNRESAARFSFLMVVPLILGKMAKDLMDGKIDFQSSQIVPLAVGFTAAFFTGLLACMWMIQIVRRSRLTVFAFYCLVVGTLAILEALNII